MIQLRSYSTFVRPPQRRYHLNNSCSHPTSKSVVLILIWAVVVGLINGAVTSLPYLAIGIFSDPQKFQATTTFTSIVFYVGLAIVSLMCYPLGGFLADVYYGRYKTVIASLMMILVSMGIALVMVVVTLKLNINSSSSTLVKALYTIGGSSTGIILELELAGFTSNIVQFGLDQLRDSPSRKLGMFVHLLVWAGRIGETVFYSLYAVKHYVDYQKKDLWTTGITYLIPALAFTVIGALLVLNCFTHRMFNKERVKYNPFKMILRVLNFIRKHKGPVGHPSAFAYCDNFQPSRMDYAKERYGGPFTTSDVEDVKTLIRVFLMLLFLGPTFLLRVPTSYFLFATFGAHTGTGILTISGIILRRGLLSQLSSMLIFPVYTWLMFSVLSKRNMLPRILSRTLFAIVIFLLSVVSLLAVDVTGHVLITNDDSENETCMFPNSDFIGNNTKTQTLNLHWSVLIFPNITKTLALDLIMASTFEFISAQSPHTMKGVLLGLLFAVRGFFQLIGAVALLPFSVEQIGEKIQVVPQLSCGTSYYLVTIVLASLGATLFTIAARKYQYRKREEEPYSQSRMEEIYDRMLREREERLIARISAIRRTNTDNQD